MDLEILFNVSAVLNMLVFVMLGTIVYSLEDAELSDPGWMGWEAVLIALAGANLGLTTYGINVYGWQNEMMGLSAVVTYLLCGIGALMGTALLVINIVFICIERRQSRVPLY